MKSLGNRISITKFIFQIVFNDSKCFVMKSRQAEAEVVPSSSLVEVRVELEVGVGLGGVWLGVGLTFSVGWVAGSLEGLRLQL